MVTVPVASVGHVPLTAGRNWLEGGVHVPLPTGEPLELPLAPVSPLGPDELLEPELEPELVLELPPEPEADSAPLDPDPLSEPARAPEPLPLPLPPEPAPLDEEGKPPPEGDAVDPHPAIIPMPNVASENHRMDAIEAPETHRRNRARRRSWSIYRQYRIRVGRQRERTSRRYMGHFKPRLRPHEYV
jgi:hypothetical protein